MTVGELVDILKAMPQDSRVVIQKPKRALGWDNSGRYLASGDVAYVNGYGTIISATTYTHTNEHKEV